MANLILNGSTSGSVTLESPAVSGTTTLTLPASTGTVVVTSGAQTIEFADGSASTPSITNSGDTNTGMFFPAADTIAFAEGGAETMRIDSSGTLLIGTTNTDPTFNRVNGFNLLAAGRLYSRASGSWDIGRDVTSGLHMTFYTDNGSARVTAGSISSNGSTTSYTTASDYRMKENIAPMTGALDKVQALKPITYDWKDEFVGTKKSTQGFIAHELQEVVPDCVTGKKDAVNEEGNPIYQGVDTSFLVATLTAAIQEQQTIINDIKAELDNVKTELDAVKVELATIKGTL
jgi:hypothetical protein